MHFAEDSIANCGALFKEHGNITTLMKGGGTRIYSPEPACWGTVLVRGPELTEQVASRPDVYHKYPLTGPLYRLRDESERTRPLNHFLAGFFGVNGKEHSRQRKLMMPGFHPRRLVTYLDDMVSLTTEQLDRLTVGETLDITRLMKRLTQHIATRALFGTDVDTEGGTASDLIQRALSLQTRISMRYLRWDVRPMAWHHYLNAIGEYEAVVDGLIREKQRLGGETTDMLSMLLQMQDEETGEGLTRNEILGHVGVFFVAGHETTATALSWTLFLLTQHPDVMADLHDELTSVLGGAAPTQEQLQQLPLLDRVIKESMRVLTPVPWNGRVTAKPVELGGYLVPKDTEVLVGLYHTHHMSELYPNPEVFDPGRWERASPGLYEYQPFSAGSRTCIGGGFAVMEMKVILSILLQRYRLEFVPSHPVNRGTLIVMAPKEGLPMKISAPDREFRKGAGNIEGNVREMVTLPD